MLEKRAHSKTGRVLGNVMKALVAPGRARNIEMDPLGFVDKVAQKQRTLDGAGLAGCRYVPDVRDIALEHRFVIFGDRQLPKSFTDRVPRAGYLLNQPRVIAHDASDIWTQTDDAGSGERSQVDDFGRAVLFGPAQPVC